MTLDCRFCLFRCWAQCSSWPVRIRGLAVRAALVTGTFEVAASAMPSGNSIPPEFCKQGVTCGRRTHCVLPDQYRTHLRAGAGVLGRIPAPHPRRTLLFAAMVLRTVIPVSVHHGGRLPVSEPGHALDLHGSDYACLGAAGGVLQHQGCGGSGMEISDRLHGGNCLALFGTIALYLAAVKSGVPPESRSIGRR